MLSDRPYMQKPSPPGKIKIPVTINSWFIVICSIIFIWCIITPVNSPINLIGIFGMNSVAVQNLQIWRLFTAPLIFDLNIFFIIEMLILYFVGRDVEKNIGPNKYLGLLIISGFCGSLTWLTFHFNLGITVPIGQVILNSIFVAFGMIYKYRKMTFLIFFILPVTLTGRTLAIGVFVLNFVFIFLGSSMSLATFGGAIGAYLYMRFRLKIHLGFGEWFGNHAKKFKGAPKPVVKRKAKSLNEIQRKFTVVSKESVEELTDEEYIEINIDPILDKIAEKGMASLTAKEKEILNQAKNNLH